MRDGGHAVAVVRAFDGGHHHDPLRTHAAEAGYRADGAVVARLDRVVLELLLRQYLTSSEIREELVPRLLVRRVVVSWWRPSIPTGEPHKSWVPATDPAVLCAVVVPSLVKTWVMMALNGEELL